MSTPKTDELAHKWDSSLLMPSDLIAAARDLERENAALRVDKERLDWLESLSGPWPTYYDGWHSRSGSHDLLRDAIDANRKEEQP